MHLSHLALVMSLVQGQPPLPSTLESDPGDSRTSFEALLAKLQQQDDPTTFLSSVSTSSSSQGSLGTSLRDTSSATTLTSSSLPFFSQPTDVPRQENSFLSDKAVIFPSPQIPSHPSLHTSPAQDLSVPEFLNLQDTDTASLSAILAAMSTAARPSTPQIQVVPEQSFLTEQPRGQDSFSQRSNNLQPPNLPQRPLIQPKRFSPNKEPFQPAREPFQPVRELFQPVREQFQSAREPFQQAPLRKTVQPAISETARASNSAENTLAQLDSLISEMKQLAKQQAAPATPGGVDFSQATRQPDGRLCVIKEESVETLSKDPILECTHKDVEKCHYTYITQFDPTQEEQCEENFVKSCQITFRAEATRERVQKCYRPQQKVCNGQGEEQCRTEFESSCTTRYIEQTPGKFVGDTKCEKLPVRICGAGCVTEEGPEECHDKDIDTIVDVPEEMCDLNPQKTCRLVTRLVPSLNPQQECTIVPKETCNLRFSQAALERTPLRTEWCLDESPEGASQSQAQPAITPRATTQRPRVNTQRPEVFDFPQQEIQPVSAPASYTSNLLEQLRRLRRQKLERY